MEFRLTYNGKLASTRGKPEKGQIDSKWKHKHDIRRAFHQQLKLFWDTHPLLSKWKEGEYGTGDSFGWGAGKKVSLPEYRGNEFEQNNFRYVPLIIDDWNMVCSLEILYLRNGAKGRLLPDSDIDNRIKTLIDALKMPQIGEIDKDLKPDDGEDPFYVLLQNDNQVTKLIVEADTLLQPTADINNDIDSRVFITVNTWSHTPNFHTVSLG